MTILKTLRLALAACATAPMIAMAPASVAAAETKVATFAAGCFWCTEADFDKIEGVVRTTSGFIGGKTKNPTYKQVTSGGTGHTEAVRIEYDPAKVSYERLLGHYWRNVDMFDLSGQFCDRGDTYRPAIFTHSDAQKNAALASRKQLNDSGRWQQAIKVPIQSATEFTAAEAYHQNFYKKNVYHYQRYRVGCGRDARLNRIWGSDRRS
ncbi:MAG: peptide-methionine (S)-S-oxide reductase MsrA [Pseudomonadota bacterium]